MDNQSFTVSNKSSLIEVLRKIDELPELQTVFVYNDNKEIIASITDGDVRRGLINGKSLSDSIENFFCENFSYLIEGENPIYKLRGFRKKKLKAVPLLAKDKKLIKLYDLVKNRSILPIDVVIMAGGKGERLRPLTNDTPKPMLPLGNKPIIEHNIDRLISYGVENVYISVNYLGSQIMDYFGDGSSKGINIKYLEEEQFLGTIGSVSMVHEFANPYVLVMNSDLFTDINFEDLWINMVEHEANLSVASIPYTVNIPFAIMTRENGVITGLKEKPSNTHYANAGIYLMKVEECKRIPENVFYNAPDLIEDIIKSGGKVIDNPITGYWIDIGRHEEYKKAQEIVNHLSRD